MGQHHGHAGGESTKILGCSRQHFLLLLPWEDVLRHLFEKVEDGDRSQWPMSPAWARHIVRLRFEHTASDVVHKFRELFVRSSIVKKWAEIYIERHVQDLQQRPGVLKIHMYRRCANVAASPKAHVHERVDALYPIESHGRKDGALLPGFLDMVAATSDQMINSTVVSNFNDKQSTMHDQARSVQTSFEHMRPALVTDEAESPNAFAPEVVAEHAMKHIVDMPIQLSNQFEGQFISKYMPRILPWALHYDCGGAEYPDVFIDWDELDQCSNQMAADSICQR